MHQSLQLLGNFGKTQGGRDVPDTLKKMLVNAKIKGVEYYLDGVSLVA